MAESISFAKYDSSAFPTIVESIAHASTNPMLIENLSDWMLMDFDGQSVIVQEPSCTFKSMLHMFEDVLQTTPLPTTDYYRPEITAKRIYDNADMWIFILLVNNIFTASKYNIPTIKYIPPTEMVRIEKFIQRPTGAIRTVADNDLTDFFI